MGIAVRALVGASFMCDVLVLRFVMRELGNGVMRAEGAAVEPLRQELLDESWDDCVALRCDVAPAVLDLAQAALRSLEPMATHLAVILPPRGTARYQEAGVTEIFLRVASLG